MAIIVGLPGGLSLYGTSYNGTNVTSANSGSYTVSQNSVSFPWYLDARGSTSTFTTNLFLKYASGGYVYDSASNAILLLSPDVTVNPGTNNAPATATVSVDGTYVEYDKQYGIEWDANSTGTAISTSNTQFYGYSLGYFWTNPIAPSFATSSLASGVSASAYSSTISVNNSYDSSSVKPTLSVTGLPAGLTATYDNAGTITISGTCPTVTTSTNYSVSVTFANNSGNSGQKSQITATFSLAVTPPPPVWDQVSLSALKTTPPQVGVAYTKTVVATSTAGGVTYTFAAAPQTARITGTLGATTLTVNSGIVVKDASITGTGIPANTTITSVTISGGVTTITISNALTTARSNASATVTTPILPSGIVQNPASSGTLAGTTTQIGTYYFTVTATAGGISTAAELVVWNVIGGGRRVTGAGTSTSLTVAKRYNGTSWVDITTRKRYNGTAWVDITN